MYEFPPPTWYMTGWWPTVYYTMILLVGVLVMIFVSGRRNPKDYDPAVITSIGLVVTRMFFTLEAEDWDSRQVASAGHFTLLWGVATFASIQSLRRLSMNQPMTPQRWGEIFIGVVMAGLLCGLLLQPAMMSETPRSRRRSVCKTNLRQIGIALHNYQDDFDSLPVHATGTPPQSWRVSLLPYVDHFAFWEVYDSEFAWDDPKNQTVSKAPLSVYRCPTHPDDLPTRTYPKTDYLAVVGVSTFWPPATPRRFQETTDGISNTLMVVEACGTDIAWAEPRDLSLNEASIGINMPGDKQNQSNGVSSSYHTGGANALFGDGSVRFLFEEIDPEVLRALLTANGGEEIAYGDF